MAKDIKKFLQIVIALIVILSTSACITTPYYGYGGGVSYYSYPVASEPYYWGYNNQPVTFSTPYYGYGSVYDPYFGFPSLGNAIIQGVGWGLGLGFIHILLGGHHH